MGHVVRILSLAAIFFATPAYAVDPAVCSPAELGTRNPELCAKAYGRDLLACVRFGEPIATCDTTRSDRFCDLVSPECNPHAIIDAALTTIYPSGAANDACRLGLAKSALKVTSFQYKRLKAKQASRLPRDFSSALANAAKRCSVQPTLGDPCSASTTAAEATYCAVNQPHVCEQISSTDFLARADQTRWGTTVRHGLSLGYSMDSTALTCGGGEPGEFVVFVSDTLPPLTLWHSEVTDSAVFIRIETDGSITEFNEGGGIHFLLDDSFQVTDSAGVPTGPVQRSGEPRTPNAECGRFWFQWVPCKILTRVVECTRIYSAIREQCMGVPPGPLLGLCMGLVLAQYKELIPQCFLPNNDPRSPSPNCDPYFPTQCDDGTVCTKGDKCSYGSCSGTPSINGLPCTNERSELPLCDGTNQITTASCHGTSCERDPSTTPCPLCGSTCNNSCLCRPCIANPNGTCCTNATPCTGSVSFGGNWATDPCRLCVKQAPGGFNCGWTQCCYDDVGYCSGIGGANCGSNADCGPTSVCRPTDHKCVGRCPRDDGGECGPQNTCIHADRDNPGTCGVIGSDFYGSGIDANGYCTTPASIGECGAGKHCGFNQTAQVCRWDQQCADLAHTVCKDVCKCSPYY